MPYETIQSNGVRPARHPKITHKPKWREMCSSKLKNNFKITTHPKKPHGKNQNKFHIHHLLLYSPNDGQRWYGVPHQAGYRVQGRRWLSNPCFKQDPTPTAAIKYRQQWLGFPKKPQSSLSETPHPTAAMTNETDLQDNHRTRQVSKDQTQGLRLRQAQIQTGTKT